MAHKEPNDPRVMTLVHWSPVNVKVRTLTLAVPHKVVRCFISHAMAIVFVNANFKCKQELLKVPYLLKQ